jgi:hypothetical protein
LDRGRTRNYLLRQRSGWVVGPTRWRRLAARPPVTGVRAGHRCKRRFRVDHHLGRRGLRSAVSPKTARAIWRARQPRRYSPQEGVDGSSPSEGFEFLPCSAGGSVGSAGVGRRLRRPRSVHQRPPWPLSDAQLVEKADRMVASVACEVAVSNGGRSWSGWRPYSGRGRRRRCRHGALRWRRCAGDRRPCAGLDPGAAFALARLAVPEVVQVEVGAPLGRE